MTSGETHANPFSSAFKVPGTMKLLKMWDAAVREIHPPTSYVSIYTDPEPDDVVKDMGRMLSGAQALDNVLHGVSPFNPNIVMSWSETISRIGGMTWVSMSVHFPRDADYMYQGIVYAKDGGNVPLKGNWEASVRVPSDKWGSGMYITFNSDGERTLSALAHKVQNFSYLITKHMSPEFHVGLSGRLVELLLKEKVSAEHLGGVLEGMRSLPPGLIEAVYDDEWLFPVLTVHRNLVSDGYGGAFLPA